MRHIIAATCLNAALVTGCIAPPIHSTDVPFIAQTEGHCGEAALAMLLEHAGRKPEPAGLRERLHLPALGGTVTDLMVQYAREQGIAARRTNAPDRTAATRSIQVPMAGLLGPFDQNGVGHYVVITGYHSGRWVSVHTGRTPHLRMNWSIFMDRWAASDYEGIVFPP